MRTFILFSIFLSLTTSMASTSLKGVTIKEGLEGPSKVSGALDEKAKRMNNSSFSKMYNLALKSGLDLNDHLDKKYIAHYGNNIFFFLFYNKANDLGCPYPYLIQRVKRTKKYISKNGNETVASKYLVEVFKLNNNKTIKRADGHWQSHPIQIYKKRIMEVEAEIGCGQIYGTAQGTTWPFDKNILYKKVQDYSDEKKLYDSIRFTSTITYKFKTEFSADGSSSYKLPSFID